MNNINMILININNCNWNEYIVVALEYEIIWQLHTAIVPYGKVGNNT